MKTVESVDVDYGPDTEREIEIKRLLQEIQDRYRIEAQPLIDELIKEQMKKVPKLVVKYCK